MMRPVCSSTIFILFVYRTKKAKYRAVIEEIVTLVNAGRPVLVGTGLLVDDFYLVIVDNIFDVAVEKSVCLQQLCDCVHTFALHGIFGHKRILPVLLLHRVGDMFQFAELLFRAFKGLPKNSALIRFLSQEGMRNLLLQTEGHYLQDNSREMPFITDQSAEQKYGAFFLRLLVFGGQFGFGLGKDSGNQTLLGLDHFLHIGLEPFGGTHRQGHR